MGESTKPHIDFANPTTEGDVHLLFCLHSASSQTSQMLAAATSSPILVILDEFNNKIVELCLFHIIDVLSSSVTIN